MSLFGPAMRSRDLVALAFMTLHQCQRYRWRPHRESNGEREMREIRCSRLLPQLGVDFPLTSGTTGAVPVREGVGKMRLTNMRRGIAVLLFVFICCTSAATAQLPAFAQSKESADAWHQRSQHGPLGKAR